jgi:hypothetical protein
VKFNFQFSSGINFIQSNCIISVNSIVDPTKKMMKFAFN